MALVGTSLIFFWHLKARAKGPSLGTIIAVSFITTLFTLLSLLFRQIQRLLRSTNFPTFLQPLTILVPILGFVAASVEVYTGFILVYVGLSGEGLRESKGKVASLLLAGRNSTLGDSTFPWFPSVFPPSSLTQIKTQTSSSNSPSSSHP